MQINKWISDEETVTLFEIIDYSFSCRSQEDYQKLIEQYKSLLFFDCALSGLIDLRRVSYNNLLSTAINSGYPPEYLRIYSENRYHLKDPLFLKFYETFDVQNSNELFGVFSYGPGHPVFKLREQFGIRNIYLFGIGDPRLSSFATISVYGRHIKNDQRTKMIIKYISPFILKALINLVQYPVREEIKPLSTSELEVLNWIKEGKSTLEIALILKKSARVINFHITNILAKLDAMNRTHAIVIALQNNLITI